VRLINKTRDQECRCYASACWSQGSTSHSELYLQTPGVRRYAAYSLFLESPTGSRRKLCLLPVVRFNTDIPVLLVQEEVSWQPGYFEPVASNPQILPHLSEHSNGIFTNRRPRDA
jgi:hypothetical protein